MKRLLIIFMALIICLPSVYARKAKKKSGKIKDNIYTDANFDFQITLLENWKTKLQKPKEICRLVLEQQEHQIPPELMQYPLMARVPVIEVYHVEEKLTPSQLVDSLIIFKYKSDLKKEMMKELLVLEQQLTFEGFEQDQKNVIEINKKRAIQWIGRMEYIKDYGMGETDRRSYGIAFIAVQNGDNMVFFSLICELQFRGKIFEEMYKMAESLKW